MNSPHDRQMLPVKVVVIGHSAMGKTAIGIAITRILRAWGINATFSDDTEVDQDMNIRPRLLSIRDRKVRVEVSTVHANRMFLHF